MKKFSFLHHDQPTRLLNLPCDNGRVSVVSNEGCVIYTFDNTEQALSICAEITAARAIDNSILRGI